MMRSSFFSIGLFVVLWGVSFLFVDKLILKNTGDESPNLGLRRMFTSNNARREKVFDPPDWAAFSLMSVGAVTMLYAVALPKKKPEGD